MSFLHVLRLLSPPCSLSSFLLWPLPPSISSHACFRSYPDVNPDLTQQDADIIACSCTNIAGKSERELIRVICDVCRDYICQARSSCWPYPPWFALLTVFLLAVCDVVFDLKLCGLLQAEGVLEFFV